MSSVNKDVLKSYFKTGAKPSEEQFENLIDSLLHIDELNNLNLIKANIPEAQKADADDRYMTPLKTKEAIKYLTRLRDIPELALEVENKINTAVNTIMGAENGDADNIINTLKEVFDFMKNIPEGDGKLLQLINSKANKTDVENELKKKQNSIDNLQNIKADKTDVENELRKKQNSIDNLQNIKADKTELDNVDRYSIRNNYKDFNIGNSSDYYYPVVINFGSNAQGVPPMVRCKVVRDFNWTAPKNDPNWHNSNTHFGALTLEFLYINNGWGGMANSDIKVLHFKNNYTIVGAKMQNPVHATGNKCVVWLKGGGAKYRIYADVDFSYNVYYQRTKISSGDYGENDIYTDKIDTPDFDSINDNIISQKRDTPTIYKGGSSPDNNLGKSGDMYIFREIIEKYTIEKIYIKGSYWDYSKEHKKWLQLTFK